MIPLRDHQPSGIFPFVTIGIILATVYVFILELTAPQPEAFIETWSLVPVRVDFADPATWYPFLTSVFLHAGFFHILSNMWFLAIFGDNVEGALGHVRFFLFYLLGGIVASVTQYFFMQAETIPLLGASGAVAAVLGYYFISFPGHTVTTLVPFFVFFVVHLPSSIVLFLWFLTQLLNGAASFSPEAAAGGTAWWAHIGGFLFGMLAASVWKPKRRGW